VSGARSLGSRRIRHLPFSERIASHPAAEATRNAMRRAERGVPTTERNEPVPKYSVLGMPTSMASDDASDHHVRRPSSGVWCADRYDRAMEPPRQLASVVATARKRNVVINTRVGSGEGTVPISTMALVMPVHCGYGMTRLAAAEARRGRAVVAAADTASAAAPALKLRGRRGRQDCVTPKMERQRRRRRAASRVHSRVAG
jgi:hypothetical protein